ncbi:MAG TPA: phospho-N-acetylmuramoyl-pentapeptide-transferase [Patescibacteria group bacterium]|nr:phospho-N-acetylmuramoyl-pentapeptide-transferase [Patescibacteria group bacterium]
MYSDDLIKIFSLSSIAFLFAIILTPLVTDLLYRFKLGKAIRSDGTTPVYSSLHEKKRGTPTMGGILIWGSTFALAAGFWFLDRLLQINDFHIFNFLTRKETLVPLTAMAGAALVGAVDDFLDIRGRGHKGRGIRFRVKLGLYALVASVGAWWFYVKLGFDAVHIPFFGDITLGWIFVPFFILVVVGTSFAVNQTDGLDGLAGGTLSIAFFCFSIIAYFEGRTNLAAMLGIVCGALLAFLWFNVHPARFFMGDTGSMALGVLLAIVAFLTNSVFLLPIIGIIFVVEAATLLLQYFWRHVFKRKLFLSSPIHHHLEALGWPESKVTMRFWILSVVAGIIGVIIFFIDK